MENVKIHTRGPVIWWLRLTKYGGCAFGNHIWVLPEKENNQKLLKHEYCHVLQCRRLGLFRWCTKYIYYHFKHGYKNNPLEVEAIEYSNSKKTCDAKGG